MVSDNGPQLTSEEPFLKLNGEKHVLFPAYHPASDGLGKRNVQTLKNVLAKADPRIPLQIGFLAFCFNTETHHTASQAVLLLKCF